MRKISQASKAKSIKHFLVKNSLLDANVYNGCPCLSMKYWLQNMLWDADDYGMKSRIFIELEALPLLERGKCCLHLPYQ
jgi:hypothetical protein